MYRIYVNGNEFATPFQNARVAISQAEMWEKDQPTRRIVVQREDGSTLWASRMEQAVRFRDTASNEIEVKGSVKRLGPFVVNHLNSTFGVYYQGDWQATFLDQDDAVEYAMVRYEELTGKRAA